MILLECKENPGGINIYKTVMERSDRQKLGWTQGK